MGKRGDNLTEKQRRFVAAFTGAARSNATEAARIAGYSGKSYGALRVVGHQIRTNPNVAAAIDAAFAEYRGDGAAIKRVRIEGKQERLAGLWRVVDARAARHAAELGTGDVFAVAATAARSLFGDATPAEAATGFLVKKETVVGSITTSEWAIDAALLKEMRELEDDIAAEVGEAPGATLHLKHSGNVLHTHRQLDLSALSDDELEALAAMGEKAKLAEMTG